MPFFVWGKSDYKYTPVTEAEAIEHLYDTKRIEDRFFLFENVCLKTLDNQTNQYFRFVVITSSLMPKPYQMRLMELAKTRPYLKIVIETRNDLNEIIRNELSQFYDDFSVKPADTVQFRLDDDDGVASGYIAALKLHSRRFLPPNGIISYPNGLVLFAEDGAFRAFRAHQPMTAQGLARKDPNRTILEMAHFRVSANLPTLSFPKIPMYFQVYHNTNDTHAARDKNITKLMKTSPNFGSEGHEEMIQKILNVHFSGFDPREKLTQHYAIQKKDPK